MLEGILEKILVSYFGTYLSGIDKSNIHFGVFTGNLIIENVGIQQKLIDLLEWPIKLKFSYVEKL